MISRPTGSIPKKDDVFPRLVYSDSGCSQACHRHSQVLPGAPEGHCIRQVNTGIWPPWDSGPTTLRHSQRLPVTRIHLADVAAPLPFGERTESMVWRREFIIVAIEWLSAKLPEDDTCDSGRWNWEMGSKAISGRSSGSNLERRLL